MELLENLFIEELSEIQSETLKLKIVALKNLFVYFNYYIVNDFNLHHLYYSEFLLLIPYFKSFLHLNTTSLLLSDSKIYSLISRIILFSIFFMIIVSSYEGYSNCITFLIIMI